MIDGACCVQVTKCKPSKKWFDFFEEERYYLQVMPLLPTLIVEEGPDKGRKFSTNNVQFSVGRFLAEREIDFVLSDADSAVSRPHFAVIRRGDTFLFTNLSRNGTSINGVRSDQALLNNNDLLRIGTSTVIRFVVDDRQDPSENPSY